MRQQPNISLSNDGYGGLGFLSWLALNTQYKPLNQKNVRQAICLAIDVKRFANIAGDAIKQHDGPIASDSPFYKPAPEDLKHNRAKAEKMLDEAGFPRKSDGMRFSLDITSGWPDAKKHSQIIVSDLRKIGIDAKAKPAADFPTWARTVGGHNFQASYDIVGNWGDPAIGVNRTYLSSNIRKGVIWSNTQSYSNPKVDTLLGNASKEMDFEKRRAMYQEFQQQVRADAPVCYLGEVDYYTAWNTSSVEGADEVDTIWGWITPLIDLDVTK